MGLTEPTKRRKIPVKLIDVPLGVRCRAARQECQHATPEEAQALLAAAVRPSDTTYYVAEEWTA